MNRRLLIAALLLSAVAALLAMSALALTVGRWVAADSPRAACQRHAPPWATAECPAVEPTPRKGAR